MDLSYSDEQRLLADSVRGVLRAHAAAPDNARLWTEMAGLGWFAMPLPEEHGGLGQGAVEVALLAEGFGRNLLGADYVPAVLLPGALVACCGTDAQRAALLPPLAEGRTRLALAHAEADARWRLSHVATRAVRSPDGFVLDGAKVAVPGGGDADTLIVSARLGGDTRDPTGIGLFLVDRDHEGVGLQRHATPDGASAARVTLARVVLPEDALLGGDGNAFAHLEAAWDRALAAWCAELVGVADALTAATIEYTKVRVQFGRPLAANQVLRHRIADMSIACEEARSTALRAALAVDGDSDGATRARTLAGAWAKIGGAARLIAEGAVQTHGGMGVTEELRIGAYLKRVLALQAIAGPPDHHLRRHAALSGRAPPTSGEFVYGPGLHPSGARLPGRGADLSRGKADA